MSLCTSVVPGNSERFQDEVETCSKAVFQFVFKKK